MNFKSIICTYFSSIMLIKYFHSEFQLNHVYEDITIQKFRFKMHNLTFVVPNEREEIIPSYNSEADQTQSNHYEGTISTWRMRSPSSCSDLLFYSVIVIFHDSNGNSTALLMIRIYSMKILLRTKRGHFSLHILLLIFNPSQFLFCLWMHGPLFIFFFLRERERDQRKTEQVYTFWAFVFVNEKLSIKKLLVCLNFALKKQRLSIQELNSKKQKKPNVCVCVL